MSARQLTLDLDQRPAFGRDDFLVAASNSEAVAWLDRWPDWPAPALAIYGPPGCGKSHLAAVWRARTGARPVDAPALARQPAPTLAAGPSPRCVIDDADAVPGDPGRESGLLHLYNHIADVGGALLLTGREAPARWPVALPDLASRLAALPAAPVGPPDDGLIGAVLVKLFADRQLRVGQEVVAFVLPRMERSLEAARSLVERIDGDALARHRRITVPFVREVLRDQGADR